MYRIKLLRSDFTLLFMEKSRVPAGKLESKNFITEKIHMS
jgi:hypothetical protein